jgi:hypothetical protein
MRPSLQHGSSNEKSTAMNKTFARYLPPNASTSPPNNEKFFTPTPTPSQSKTSIIRPMPSVSCKSGYSIQSFHTAIGEYDEEEEDQQSAAMGNSKKLPSSNLFAVKEEPSSSCRTKYTNDQQRQPTNFLSRRSSTANDLLLYHPTAPPTTSSSSMMVHPMSLVNSYTNNSIPSNFFYYGSLDSGMLSKSPAGSYFYDYYSEDYEVILDDGTRQKRSVSLSTMPIVTPLEFNKMKYKGNYNHYFYQNEDELNNRPKNTSQSQAEE